MAIWKISAKRKFNNGTVVFEPGMEIDYVLHLRHLYIQTKRTDKTFQNSL